MTACDQELCPNWDGHSCPCQLFGIGKFGVELEERYCEIAARRLDQMCLDFGTEVGK